MRSTVDLADQPPSRIPVRSRRFDEILHARTLSAPSKLERLAAQYQQRIQQNKEVRLLQIQQELDKRDLNRVQKYQNDARITRTNFNSAGNNSGPPHGYQPQPQGPGMLREFFKERRQNANNKNTPNITQHYQRKRAEYSNSLNSGGSTRSMPSGRPPLPQTKSNTVGRDRTKPLEPLDRRPVHQRRFSDTSSPVTNHSPAARHSPKPPPFEKKPQMVRKPRRGSLQSGYTSGSETGASSPALPDSLPSDRALIPIPHKTRKVTRAPAGTHTAPAPKAAPVANKWQKHNPNPRDDHVDSQRSGTNSQRSEPPTYREKRNANRPPPPPQQQQQEKLTDFQKWQLEQNKMRDDRLRKLNSKPKEITPPESPVSYVDSDRSLPSQRALDPVHSNKSTARTPTKPQGRKPLEPITPKKQAVKKGLSDEEVDSGVEDEETKELKRKEAKLMALINEQQKILDDMKQQRKKEDQKLVEEREKREQRAAQQKKRQQKLREREERNHSQASRQDEDSYSRQDDYETNHRDNHSRQDSRMLKRRDSMSRNKSRNSPHSDYTDANRGYTEPAPKPKPQPKAKPPPRPAPERQPTPNNENTAFYLELAAREDAVESLNLAECSTCGRKFAEDRLLKHAKVCKATAKKKPRKVFDPVKMRADGTEYAKYTREAEKAKAQKTAPKDSWRKKHEDFVKSIRYAKKVTEMEKSGANVAELPPPPVSENPDYVKCPYCSRSFNPHTADRHIPKCKDIKARPAPPKHKRR